jgi:L-aspartate oxidase
VIRDRGGRAVMADLARGGDLAPRDVVSRAMALEMRATGTDHLFLDATEIGPAIAERFPNFVGASQRAGIDPAHAWVPIAPAVHYVMGGVRTDTEGRASLPGLYAVGEVAQSGVHGANRLASNSLVEGVVFGRRAAATLVGELVIEREPSGEGGDEWAPIVERGWLRQTMTEQAGVLRAHDALSELAGELQRRSRPNDTAEVARLEDANLLQLARLVVGAACRREESRGAHFRLDAPESSPAWLVHQSLRRDGDGAVTVDDVAVSSGAAEVSASARR